MTTESKGTKKVLDCGDNSCLFMELGRGGMRSNGGCRCFNGTFSRILIRERLEAYEALEAENKRLKEEIFRLECEIKDMNQ